MTVARPWRWVALLAVSAIASYLVRVNITVAGDAVMREGGLSQSDMGRVFSAFGLGYTLCMLPAGMLADHWGTRRTLLVAALGWTVATLALAVAGMGPASALGLMGSLLVLRVALGVAEAPTFTAAALGVARWVPASAQGRANGFVLAAIGVGSALAPLLVTQLTVTLGWRAAMAITAAPALLVAVAWWRVREPAPTQRPPASRRTAATPWHHLLRHRSFALLTLSYTLQGYVGFIFVTWFYLYLVQVRRFTLAQSQWVASLPWVLTLLSIPIGGWISDQLASGSLGAAWGRRAVPLVALVGGGVLLAWGASTLNPWVAAFALAAATASVLAVEGPFWATMLSLSGDDAGTAGGLMNLGGNIGGLISPALTPLLAERIGWERALHVAAALGIVAGLLWLGVTPGRAVTSPGRASDADRL